MKEKKIRVLFVDDDEDTLRGYYAAFRREFDVTVSISAEKGLEVLKSNEIDVIITDQRMPNVMGAEFLEKSLELAPEVTRIVLTAYASNEEIVNSINKGKVHGYMNKPYDHEKLIKMIKETHYKRQNNLI